MSGRARILWGGLALVAVVIVTAAVTRKVVTERWAREHAVVVAVPQAPAIEAEKSASAAAETAAAPQEAATAKAVVPSASAANTDMADPADLDLEAVVKDLTAEQREKLEAESQKVQGERLRLASRYQMQSDVYFYSMSLAAKTRPELKLTDAQESQLKAVQETLEARLDSQLAGVWARLDEIHQHMQGEGGGPQPAPAALGAKDDPRIKEMQALYDQEKAVKAEYDADYEMQRMGILTDEQQKFVEARRAEFARFMKAVQ